VERLVGTSRLSPYFLSPYPPYLLYRNAVYIEAVDDIPEITVPQKGAQ